MAYWLLKSESDEWSWAEHVANGRDGAEWTGIRNHAAQKYLRAMKKGERAFFYHTGKERAIVGIVEVIAEATPIRPTPPGAPWTFPRSSSCRRRSASIESRRTSVSRAWPWPGCRARRSNRSRPSSGVSSARWEASGKPGPRASC